MIGFIDGDGFCHLAALKTLKKSLGALHWNFWV